ncbi:enoyl-CoA hydratase-related protein [Nocardia abscessus]|uniref:enoyl-CoA hydratase-related protein n=1 Tax=Nocardia abscessus TaxID=120957 RepID=UPI002454F675|nr:enoyl-CoA hydratase-related protein [Nocardia abscessus]
MTQRVLVLASANNGLTQRAALAIRRSGRRTRTEIVHCAADIRAAAGTNDFDIVVCPYLTTKIPADVHERWTCIVVHPGPVGDRGPHALDWAVSEREPLWGVTALTAVEEMDAGPIWCTRTFPLPAERKSAVYNTVVADAAIECLLEALDKAAAPGCSPTPQDEVPRSVAHARTRPAMHRRDREIRWTDDADTILRRIHAGDGSPGAPATIGNAPMLVYDACRGQEAPRAAPGTVLRRRDHAVEVACGDAGIWIGRLEPLTGDRPPCKGPAVPVLAAAGFPVEAVPRARGRTPAEIRYRRSPDIGFLDIDFYNGAMGTAQCDRLLAAFGYAAAQNTKVLVLANDGPYFSNGIDLNAVELSADPEGEAWRNLLAINNVCRAILTCSTQVTVAAVSGSAGAGGVMLALTADLVVAAERVVFNPHYRTIGLSGSEFHTYTLPRRVGEEAAQRLLDECRPVDAAGAADLGLIDAVVPNGQFGTWPAELAVECAHPARWAAIMAAKQTRSIDLTAFESAELRRMARDIFRDQNEFRRRRHEFVFKSSWRSSATGTFTLSPR